ncbi:TetR/AcrR family transcriptional regulator [Limosilactobacillus reuteri]|nr:TetR/AcrR family transcriptional regulator [Limosilactobacillus reuteri]
MLEFATYGFENVTTKDIAAKAHVSEGSIFRYFKSKRDLLESAILPSVKEMIPQELNNVSRNLLKNQGSISFKDFLESFYKNRYQFVLQHYPALKIYFSQLLFDYESQKKFKKTTFKLESVDFIKVIKEMQKEGEIIQNVKPSAVVYEIIVQFVGSVIKLRFMYGNNPKVSKSIDLELKRIVNNIIKIYGGAKYND